MSEPNPWLLIPLGVAALVMFGIHFGVNALSRRFKWGTNTRGTVFYLVLFLLIIVLVTLSKALINGH